MLLVDAHVHFHKCFHADGFLAAAAENFRASAAQLDPDAAYQAALCLTETSRADWFGHLSECAQSGHSLDGWRVSPTGESRALIMDHDVAGRLFVIAGRQIVTAERLEILAIASDETFEDGLPIRDTIARVDKAGAIAVLPWGFGKWMGRRGKLVRELVGEPRLMFGDNSGRPALWPTPAEFDRASSRGIPVLPGTDPLPFAREFRRPGSFGFVLDADVSASMPATDLVRLLRDSDRLQPYGRGENPIRFCVNQVAMQFRKREAAG